MRGFFRFLRNLVFLGILAFGVWTYQNNSQIRTATNDSLFTLKQRVTQLIATGNFAPPTLSDSGNNTQTSSTTKTSTSKSKSSNRVWPKNTATVYIDIPNDAQLRSATLDAMSAWNRTGAFLFKQTSNKAKANIVVSTVSNSDTEAAGQTSISYNPLTNHLIKAKVELNRYYLQNAWYGYSYSRIVNTAEHELGHAIGLEHSKTVSVMYPAGSYYTIQPRDIAAVKKLYSAR